MTASSPLRCLLIYYMIVCTMFSLVTARGSNAVSVIVRETGLIYSSLQTRQARPGGYLSTLSTKYNRKVEVAATSAAPSPCEAPATTMAKTKISAPATSPRSGRTAKAQSVAMPMIRAVKASCPPWICRRSQFPRNQISSQEGNAAIRKIDARSPMNPAFSHKR